MRPLRITLVALVAFCSLAIPTMARSADASDATLPPALGKVTRIQTLYPVLYRHELARKDRDWNRLRRAARQAWMRSHVCHHATLQATARLRGYWAAVEATWSCAGMPEAKRRFLRCIPRYEGGYQHPDVHFGGRRGYPPDDPGAARNVVLGPWQVRPGWISGAMQGRPGVYAEDHWTPELYRWALDPVNMARTVAAIGNDQYATARFCS